MKQTLAMHDSLAEFSLIRHLEAHFDRLFPEMREPDPIAADEAVEGIVGMPEEGAP